MFKKSFLKKYPLRNNVEELCYNLTRNTW